MKKLLCLFWVLMWVFPSFAQRFSANPDEFISQLDKELRLARQEKFAEQFRSTWTRGSFTTSQQEKIINLVKLIVGKGGGIGSHVKTFLSALENGLEKQTISSSQVDAILSVAERFFSAKNSGEIYSFVNSLHSLLTYKALYFSKMHRLYVDGSFEIVYADSLLRKQHAWFQGWQEVQPEPDSLGNIKPYPHPLVAGAVVLFPKTNLYFVSPYDSVSINQTKLAFLFENNYIVGDGGRFSWENLYNRGNVDSVALGSIARVQIYADFSRYSHQVSDLHFEADNVTLTYPAKLKIPELGRFEFFSEQRKKNQPLRFPRFVSYDDKADLINIGENMEYIGGMKLEGFSLYGYSPTNRPVCRLLVYKDGQVKFHANSKQFYLGEDRIYSKNASFGYYVSGNDSLTHNNIALSYNKVKIAGDTTPVGVFKLYKDKTNDDIPFIDEYHKIYITADLALYNPQKNTIDFYIVGAQDKVPALFESFNYYDEDRYEELQGEYNFHPLRMVDYYAKKYGVMNSQGTREFNIDGAFAMESEENLDKKKAKNNSFANIKLDIIKRILTKLAREGYVDYDEYTGRVVVLNRTTHTIDAHEYKRAMDFLEKNPKKKLPKYMEPYVDKDFDDMLIYSISPRDASKDSILTDTVKFHFTNGRILYKKLEGKNIFITKRVFRPKPDTLESPDFPIDTLITLIDTFKIDKFQEIKKVAFTEELELNKLNPDKFFLWELEGFFTKSERKKGPAMPNASVLPDGGGMIIRGVEKFAISKKLNVYFIPKNKEIKIFGASNFFMEEGEVTVGNFKFVGKNFMLPYDEFKLTMETLDSVVFIVPDPKNPDIKHELGGEIRFYAGDLLISHPKNISGLKKGQIPGGKKGEVYESYPKLKIATGGRIYFDAFYRQKYAYHKHQAYFEIPRVEMDSLTTKIPKFEGTFYSNMFPPIKEVLVPIYDPKYTGVESRYALGFVHEPKKPLKLYNTQGELTADSIVMYKTGLIATGKKLEIKNHSYSVKAPYFLFTPDSVVTAKANIIVKQQKVKNTFYPEAVGEDMKLTWYTSRYAGKDTLKIDSLTLRTSPDKLVRIFDEKNPSSFKGTLALTPEALWAIGELKRKDFFMLAPKGASISPQRIYTLQNPENIIDFKVYSTEIDPFEKEQNDIYKPIIDANAVFIDFDLKNNICKISNNPAIAEQDLNYEFITFPYAQFKTSIREVTWNVAKQEVTMIGDENTTFRSTHYEEEENAPNKDLLLKASKGKYDMKDLNNPVLDLEGVSYISSADARIIPDKNKVTISKGATIQELKNATVILDTISFHHTLINGNIKINHREDFEGDATYLYVNVAKDTFKLKFDRFKLVDSEQISEAGKTKIKRKRKKGESEDTLQIPKRYTQSRGEVREEDNFFIKPRIKFKGTVEMLAYKKDLILDGFIQIQLQSKKYGSHWIPYQRDAGDVYIELDEKNSSEADLITAGLHYTYEENGKLYTTFLSGKKGDNDSDMYLAKGVFTYTPELNEFKIIDKARLEKESYEGTLLTLDDEKGILDMQGKFKLVDEKLQKFVLSAGSAKVNLKKDEYELTQMFAFDLSKAKSPLSGVADLFKYAKMDGSAGDQAYNSDDASLISRLAEIVGNDKAKKYENQARTKYHPLLQADKKVLGKGLVLSQVNLKWSDTTNSFYSVGKIGLANILDKDVNAMVEGFMEIQKLEDGDIINLYLELTPEQWIFLSLTQNILSAESSVEKINTAFEKGKKAKSDKDLALQLADNAAETFKRHFMQQYLGKKIATLPEKEQKQIDETEEEVGKKEKKKSKKKKQQITIEENNENTEPLQEQEEKPKKEKKSKKKTQKEDEEESTEKTETQPEPKKDEEKKEKKNKDKPKDENKPKDEKPKEEKPKKEKKGKKKKGEEEEEEEPTDEEPKDEKKKDKKKDDKDGF